MTMAATGDAAAPCWRAPISLTMAAFMPAASSVRPSRLVPVATTCAPTSLRPASCAVWLTFWASVVRIGSRPDSSKTGAMLPSAAVEKEISGASLARAMVQVGYRFVP